MLYDYEERILNEGTIKIAYDFNVYLKWGYGNPVPLSKTASALDFEGNAIALSEGMGIRIFEVDYDELGRRDDLYADGVALRASNSNSGFEWWFQINDSGIRHESDSPDSQLP